MSRITHHGLTLGISLFASLVLAALVAAGAARGGAQSVYTDPAGDSASAPDIRAVTLTDNGNGTVGFQIDLGATLPDDGSAVGVAVDADRNPQTGDGGQEFLLIADAQGVTFLEWDGAEWGAFSHQAVSPRLDGGRLTFTVTLADLGVTTFDFMVGGLHGEDVDAAPDTGVYTYPAPAAQPVPAAPVAPAPLAPVPLAPAKPTIAGIVVQKRPLTPKAGKTFSVPAPRVRLSDDELVRPGSYSCTLTFHGKTVKPVGKCTWKLAKTTRGKTLSLKLTVAYRGTSRSLTLAVRPR